MSERRYAISLPMPEATAIPDIAAKGVATETHAFTVVPNVREFFWAYMLCNRLVDVWVQDEDGDWVKQVPLKGTISHVDGHIIEGVDE